MSLLNRKYHLSFPANAGSGGIFLLGVASTAAWTPCNGPLLAPVLVYASTSPSLLKGVALFFIYALGFCIPFALLSVTLQRYLIKIRLRTGWLHILPRIAGVILAITGLSIFFDLLS